MTASDWASGLASQVTEVPAGTIPVLSTVLPSTAMTPALQAALDARAQDRAALVAIQAQLLDALRPEIERLTLTLVERSVQQVWHERTRLPS